MDAHISPNLNVAGPIRACPATTIFVPKPYLSLLTQPRASSTWKSLISGDWRIIGLAATSLLGVRVGPGKHAEKSRAQIGFGLAEPKFGRPTRLKSA